MGILFMNRTDNPLRDYTVLSGTPMSTTATAIHTLMYRHGYTGIRLFACGVIAIAVTFSTTAVGAGVAATHVDLSPVGGAAGQQTEGQSQNQSGPAVEFANQTTNGSTVTVQSVTLSQPGFVAVHTSAYTDGLVGAAESVIAVSRYLPASQYRNLTLDISNAPPGNPHGLNRSRLNSSQRLTVTLTADTNANRRYDYMRSFSETDTLVTSNGSVVRDLARVHVPKPSPQTASVVFRNQTLQNHTLTVSKARLPRGGFVIVHNASYRWTGDAVRSAVALSRYLSPGTYTNVSLRVVPGALAQTQVVTVRPSLDTNDNQQYDFVRSGGFRDVAYETVNRSGVITVSARVRVPAPEHATSPVRSPTRTSSTSAAGDETSEGDNSPSDLETGLGSGIGGLLVILAVVGGLILVIRVVR